MVKKNIPDEDMKAINQAFKNDKPSDVIVKDARGKKITSKKDIVDSKGYKIQSFFGRKLKHDKSLIPRNGTQVKIAKKGQKYDDIPESDRKKVSWCEADFE